MAWKKEDLFAARTPATKDYGGFTGGIFREGVDEATKARLDAMMKARKPRTGGGASPYDVVAHGGAIGKWSEDSPAPTSPAGTWDDRIYFDDPSYISRTNIGPNQMQMFSAQQTAPAPTAGAAPATSGYTPVDYDALFGNIGKARKEALDAALLNQQQQIASQGNALKGQYDDLRGGAYTNARVTALGNNERLAATGLAGNAYAGPQSGYSETSRVAQDVGLGNALNALSRQEQGARNDLMTQENSARLGRDQQLGATMADLEGQKMQAIAQQNQFQAGYEQEQARQAEDIRRYNETKAAQDQAAALQKAMQEVQTFGRVMTKETAELLGVKVGTRIKK